MRWSIALCVLFLLVSAQVVLADMPRTMSYQGVLRQGDGTLVSDGDYEVIFRLYDVELGGSPVWTETDSVTVAGGIFDVILGKETSLNLAFDDTYWLSVEVEGGGELAPRVELAATPYALRAAVADSVPVSAGGFPQGGIIMWSGPLSQIPSGWALCDGTNGTPDLRDQFIYGWTDGVDPGGTGGSSSHSHTVNAHSHLLQAFAQYYWRACSPWQQVGGGSVTPQDIGYGPAEGVKDDGGASQWTRNAVNTIGTAGANKPYYREKLGINANTGNASPGTSSANHLPPYYKLAFIMKL